MINDLIEDYMEVELDEQSRDIYVKIITQRDSNNWADDLTKAHNVKDEILHALETQRKVDRYYENHMKLCNLADCSNAIHHIYRMMIREHER